MISKGTRRRLFEALSGICIAIVFGLVLVECSGLANNDSNTIIKDKYRTTYRQIVFTDTFEITYMTESRAARYSSVIEHLNLKLELYLIHDYKNCRSLDTIPLSLYVYKNVKVKAAAVKVK